MSVLSIVTFPTFEKPSLRYTACPAGVQTGNNFRIGVFLSTAADADADVIPSLSLSLSLPSSLIASFNNNLATPFPLAAGDTTSYRIQQQKRQ